ncbi:hypothetical protein [Erysipelothrix sp. HDW6A]|uniref:hypothetical protein n=1 Tax=Erysipelothrix sp. HDW6A TaxID=2714928 RepID=UPI001F0EC93D|nr:hypothetical protein [Erysipelothrix sp. HDW6A]
MEGITRFIEEKIAPPLIKFSQLKYVQVMQRTGLGVMSLLVIGSVFLLVASFPIKAWTDFLGISVGLSPQHLVLVQDLLHYILLLLHHTD